MNPDTLIGFMSGAFLVLILWSVEKIAGLVYQSRKGD